MSKLKNILILSTNSIIISTPLLVLSCGNKKINSEPESKNRNNNNRTHEPEVKPPIVPDPRVKPPVVPDPKTKTPVQPEPEVKTPVTLDPKLTKILPLQI